MAARWIPDPKVGGSNPSSLTSKPFLLTRAKKIFYEKNASAETGNRTQAAAATTRSPATRLFRLVLWRIRVSIPVLNLAKVVCYHVQQSPRGGASIGTRTRILSLEGMNTTLVLWTHGKGRTHPPASQKSSGAAPPKRKQYDNCRIRTDEGIAH